MAAGAQPIMVSGAEVAELADVLRSGRSAPCGRVSSNLTFGTNFAPVAQWIERYPAEVEVRGSNPLWRTTPLPPPNRQEGWSVNHKRVERLWRKEGLRLPRKQPKRGRLWLADGAIVRRPAERPNDVCSYDFVFERTADGRASGSTEPWR